MNILFLDHPQHTHGTWTLWEGLQRVLGGTSTIDYPHKKTLHGDNASLMDVAWYRRVYDEIAEGQPLPAGVPSLSPDESLTTEDQRFVALSTVPTMHVTPSPQREHDEPEITRALDNGHFQLIVLGNSHRVPTIALARLRDRCLRPLPPVVYYDAGERDELNAHWWHAFRPALVFKQILTPEVRDEFVSPEASPRVPCRLWPLPLANPFAVHGPDLLRVLGGLPIEQRPLDVVSYFGPTWPERADVQRRVEQVCRRNGLSASLRGLLSLPDAGCGLPYFAFLAQTKVGVSMRGSGRDTDRYWQIPAFGAAMLSDGTMGCVHPFPFRDGVTAFFYRSLDDLEERLVYLHNHDAERSRVARAGRAHLARYHSVEARALFFLGVVARELDLASAFTTEQHERLDFWYKKLEWPSPLPEWEGPVVGFGDAP